MEQVAKVNAASDHRGKRSCAEASRVMPNDGASPSRTGCDFRESSRSCQFNHEKIVLELSILNPNHFRMYRESVTRSADHVSTAQTMFGINFIRSIMRRCT